MAGMKPDTTVTLGGFAFADTEVPEKMPFGGKQALVSHDLVGGVRVIDAMGGFEGPIEWSGMFLGSNALARARALDTMRRAGKSLQLTWSELTYTVVIESFSADFERFYQIPYRITCTVAKDNAKDAPVAGKVSLDGQVRSDTIAAGGLSDLIGNAPLSGLVTTLSTAVSAVSDFSKATQSQINTVLAPLAAVQVQVKNLIATVGNTVANITTVGGVAPYNPIAVQAAKLTQQVTGFTQLPQLYNLQSVLGRMGTNLNTSTVTGQTVSVAGGNLMVIAAQQFGDATAWPLIATANGLKDPQVTGLKTLAIPPAPPTNQPVGGILSA